MKSNLMPNILFCNVDECAYNDQEKCHAGAITVDGPQPLCDTFFKSGRKGGVDDVGAVGACKNDVCAYNESFECTAHGINVSLRSSHPQCDTFVERTHH